MIYKYKGCIFDFDNMIISSGDNWGTIKKDNDTWLYTFCNGYEPITIFFKDWQIFIEKSYKEWLFDKKMKQILTEEN